MIMYLFGNMHNIFWNYFIAILAFHHIYNKIKHHIILRAIQKCKLFMSVQTVHFFRPLPPPLQEYRPTFLVSKIWVSRKTFIVQEQKLTLILSLFDI